jgi:hypothetical protein
MTVNWGIDNITHMLYNIFDSVYQYLHVVDIIVRKWNDTPKGD